MILVVGLTRSGLSLTMQMLHAGGHSCFGGPPAFDGYDLGKIPWRSVGMMAVKVVETHLQFPPRDFGPFRVIRLGRDFREQAKSFRWL